MLHGVGMGAPFSIPPTWSPGVRGLKNSNFSAEKAASAFAWTCEGIEALRATHLSPRLPML